MPVASFQDKLVASGARIGPYRGAETFAAFGDTAAEFRALVESWAVSDLGWQAKLVLTGEDRVRWLNGMVTNNVRDLLPGYGNYSFVLSAQGKIQADLVAYNRGDHLLVTTERQQAATLSEIFDRYIIMDDVEVADISDKLATLGVAGPKAATQLALLGLVAKPLQSGEIQDAVWRDIGISVVRSSLPHMDGYEVWLAPENLELLWDALVSAGATPAGSDALELFRIARGVPRFGIDLRSRDLPQETGQTHALNFAKGCYIGQEIVERIRSRAIVHRSFTGFEVEANSAGALGCELQSTVPAAGDKIIAEGKEVGEITSAAALPFALGERILALGYLRREVAPGAPVEVGGGVANIRTLPFSE